MKDKSYLKKCTWPEKITVEMKMIKWLPMFSYHHDYNTEICVTPKKFSRSAVMVEVLDETFPGESDILLCNKVSS